MLTPGQAAERLGVSASMINYLVSEGRLPFGRSSDGGRRWFDPAHVEQLVEERKNLTLRDVERLAECPRGTGARANKRGELPREADGTWGQQAVDWLCEYRQRQETLREERERARELKRAPIQGPRRLPRKTPGLSKAEMRERYPWLTYSMLKEIDRAQLIPRTGKGLYVEEHIQDIEVLKPAAPPIGKLCRMCSRREPEARFHRGASRCAECMSSIEKWRREDARKLSQTQRDSNFDLVYPEGRQCLWCRKALSRESFYIDRGDRCGTGMVCKKCTYAWRHGKRTEAARAYWSAAGVDGRRCWHCKRPVDPTLDHFVPASKGGLDTETNLVPACTSCNSSKGAKLDWVDSGPEPPEWAGFYFVRENPARPVREYVAERHYTGSCLAGTDRHTLRQLGEVRAAAVYTRDKQVARALFDEPADVRVLHRLVTDEDVQTGRFLAKSLRSLPSSVIAVMTYADPSQGHSGVVYRATNAKYLGMTGLNREYRSPEGVIVPGRSFRRDLSSWRAKDEAAERAGYELLRQRRHKYLYLLKTERWLRKNGLALKAQTISYPQW